MLQPVGPLPSQVYWRRRLVILGGIVVVLLLGLAMCSGSGGTTPRRTTNGAALTGPATPASTAPGATTGPATITPSPGSAGGPAPGAPATSTAGTGEPGSTDPGSSGGPTGSGGGPVGAPGSGAAPQPCPDEALLVQAVAAEPSYHVGETPVLRLTVRNTGSAACVRDVGPRQQEMLLYAGSTRLWSSNDCYPDGGTDIRTLAPGEQVTSTVVWSGLSSQRGCAGTRTRVKAGTYQLTARVGSAHSKPAKLVLN